MVKCKPIPSQLSPRRIELELFKCHTDLTALPRLSVVCHTALTDPITIVKCTRKFQYCKKYKTSKQEAKLLTELQQHLKATISYVVDLQTRQLLSQ